ncbi:MAG: DNA primase [Bacilli bacterium]|nr:DNA primase [Bacilli bacterium]MDD4282863.1 DNA primase [Bacilli bacterium]MDD4719059.1 DNA primase [Bacilli bacterium]
MNKLSNDEINNIRNSVNIVDIVSTYIPLTKRGKNHFGVCPFHDDRDPSLSVSEEKQIYTCFSCGATGNVFTFIMDYDHVSFYDSLKKVADAGGITFDFGNFKPTVKKYNELYEIYEVAQLFYQNNIYTEQGTNAREYLFNRGFNEDVIKEFGIGLSLKDNEMLTKLLLKKKFEVDNLIKSGLVVNNNYGHNDIYYNRIMFPLTDITGKIVGYSGRIYNNEDSAKYINTKETPIFKKGELLYNYHRAIDECRQKKQVIIMEGFMDVIRCHASGIKNTVATMGTAITKNQALLIKKIAPDVIICFDGDDAGARATMACSNELMNIGVVPKIVRLENHMDPDDYIKGYGVERFKYKLEKAMNIMDFKLLYLKNNRNLGNSSEMANYINDVLRELNLIDDEILRELTLKKVSDESGIDINILKKQLEQKEKSLTNVLIAKKETKEKPKIINKYIMAEQNLLFYMLKNKEVISVYNKNVSFMPTSRYRFLAQEINYFYREYKYFDLADFFSFVADNEEIIKTVGEIQNLKLKDDYTLEEIDDYVNVIREYHINYECKRLMEQMNKETDAMKKALIAEKIKELKVGIKL